MNIKLNLLTSGTLPKLRYFSSEGTTGVYSLISYTLLFIAKFRFSPSPPLDKTLPHPRNNLSLAEVALFSSCSFLAVVSLTHSCSVLLHQRAKYPKLYVDGAFGLAIVALGLDVCGFFFTIIPIWSCCMLMPISWREQHPFIVMGDCWDSFMLPLGTISFNSKCSWFQDGSEIPLPSFLDKLGLVCVFGLV